MRNFHTVLHFSHTILYFYPLHLRQFGSGMYPCCFSQLFLHFFQILIPNYYFSIGKTLNLTIFMSFYFLGRSYFQNIYWLDKKMLIFYFFWKKKMLHEKQTCFVLIYFEFDLGKSGTVISWIQKDVFLLFSYTFL